MAMITSQCATSIVNRCWSGFPCKWRYINVETFNLLAVKACEVHKAHRVYLDVGEYLVASYDACSQTNITIVPTLMQHTMLGLSLAC